LGDAWDVPCDALFYRGYFIECHTRRMVYEVY
jgi:hypothetical protein